MIIVIELMVHICLMDYFKQQVIQWDNTAVPMKEASIFIGQTDLAGHNMGEVLIQTGKPSSTKQATELMINIIEITYSKAEL